MTEPTPFLTTVFLCGVILWLIASVGRHVERVESRVRRLESDQRKGNDHAR